mgnify:CR=1 FL=1
MLKDPPASLNASLADSSHNPMDWQGRDYENIEGIELAIFWSIIAIFGTVLGIAMFNIFN